MNHLRRGQTGRISGIQGEVLKLYRDFIRAARVQEKATQTGLKIHIRSEFEKNRGISRIDSEQIEHFLRKGKRQLETLKRSSISGLSFINIANKQ
jgi:succinate dehydrogenase assembly factor 1